MDKYKFVEYLFRMLFWPQAPLHQATARVNKETAVNRNSLEERDQGGNDLTTSDKG